jgi:hypothetical protein
MKWHNCDDFVWTATANDGREFRIQLVKYDDPDIVCGLLFELECDGVNIGGSSDPEHLRNLADKLAGRKQTGELDE